MPSPAQINALFYLVENTAGRTLPMGITKAAIGLHRCPVCAAAEAEGFTANEDGSITMGACIAHAHNPGHVGYQPTGTWLDECYKPSTLDGVCATRNAASGYLDTCQREVSWLAHLYRTYGLVSPRCGALDGYWEAYEVDGWHRIPLADIDRCHDLNLPLPA